MRLSRIRWLGLGLSVCCWWLGPWVVLLLREAKGLMLMAYCSPKLIKAHSPDPGVETLAFRVNRLDAPGV